MRPPLSSRRSAKGVKALITVFLTAVGLMSQLPGSLGDWNLLALPQAEAAQSCNVSCMNTFMGLSSPTIVGASGKGGTVYYWDKLSDRGDLFAAAQACGFDILKAGNYNSSMVRDMVQSVVGSQYRYLSIDGACNQSNVNAYRSAGHNISETDINNDGFCNFPFLQEKLNLYHSPTDRFVDGIGDGGREGHSAVLCAGTTTLPQCSDSLDNDNDGKIDQNDPGCYTNGVYNPNDNDETDPKAQCSDGIDNDNDGKIDFNDPGCYTNGVYNPNDNSEVDQPLPQCSDGIDNDGDGKIDAQDPGCYTNGVYNPNDNDEYDQQLPQCSDGRDNDGDNKIDYFDPGCYPNGIFDSVSYSPNDNDESNQAPNPNQCRWERVNNKWVRKCS